MAELHKRLQVCERARAELEAKALVLKKVLTQDIYRESEREREAKAHVLQKHTLRKPIETHYSEFRYTHTVARADQSHARAGRGRAARRAGQGQAYVHVSRKRDPVARGV